MNEETIDQSQHHDQFDQVLDKLEAANNILVTLKANPSIDELSALIGLTLTLNKIGKHATAVFSGKVPPVLEFLRPEETIEINTNSLRDFIIAIDKAKADKLRYKVEGDVVRIFITPYRTSLSGDDLEFSQGDFNIDAIVALGVHDKTDLDKAIVAHGKILHDAVVVSITNDKRSELGNVLWVDDKASSLCEMTADVAHALDTNVFDDQIATAFLTGIVSETSRFSNEKTTPHAMSIAGVLMAGGANAQLISTKLDAEEERHQAAKHPRKVEDNKPIAVDTPEEASLPTVDTIDENGMLTIDHPDEPVSHAQNTDEPLPQVPEPIVVEDDDQIHIDAHGTLRSADDIKAESYSVDTAQDEAQDRAVAGSIITEPPTFTGTLTANTDDPNKPEPSTDPLSVKDTEKSRPMMSHSPLSSAPLKPAPTKTIQPLVSPIDEKPEDQAIDLTLAAQQPALNAIDDARLQVAQASIDAPINTNIHAPTASIGATSVDLGTPTSQPQALMSIAPNFDDALQAPLSPGQPPAPAPTIEIIDPVLPSPLSPGQSPADVAVPITSLDVSAGLVSPIAPPPPVPPPMMPTPSSRV